MTHTQVWSIVGGQAGSEGKGKAAGYLAYVEKPDVTACAFTANAGHTAYTVDGVKVVTHTLPIGAFFSGSKAVLGPGAAINVQRLIGELDVLHVLNPQCRVYIDPNALLISKQQVDWETERMVAISSTCQGVGKALADRVLRRGDAVLARDAFPSLDGAEVGDTVQILQDAYFAGDKIQIEGCQGIDIDVLYGIQYPYTTSRSITGAAVANDSGFPAGLVERTIAVFRTYPIRVGNVVKDGERIGWSGPIPMDSREYSWPEITELAGSPLPLEEKTTVTQKVRRIFSWSMERYAKSIWMHGATDVWVNFADYLDWNLHSLGGDLSEMLIKYPHVCDWFDDHVRREILFGVGTGPGLYSAFVRPL